MSVKIDHMLRRELDLPLVKGIFWCDSTSVIQLIRNTSKRFHPFVANRLSVIHDGSSPEQWRYVDSKSNPADDVSRGITAEYLIKSKRWLNGPDFLCKTEECWPKRIVVADLSNEHPNVKPEGRVLMASHQNALYPFIDHYSSWDRLKRGVAWLLRFKGYLAGKLHGEQGFNQRIVKGGLSVEEIFAAERAVLTAVQQETFKDHFTRTSGSHSPLHKLCPVLVDGTLRVGGCLGNAHISEEAKRPIILPEKHHVTDIIIRKYHEELAQAENTCWPPFGRRFGLLKVLWQCDECCGIASVAVEGMQRQGNRGWLIYLRNASSQTNHPLPLLVLIILVRCL